MPEDPAGPVDAAAPDSGGGPVGGALARNEWRVVGALVAALLAVGIVGAVDDPDAVEPDPFEFEFEDEFPDEFEFEEPPELEDPPIPDFEIPEPPAPPEFDFEIPEPPAPPDFDF